MTRFAALILAIIIFGVGCKNKIDDKLAKEIIKTLEQNNEMLESDAENMSATLKALTEKPATREKAIYWSSRAFCADSLLYSFCERIKNTQTSISYEDLNNLFINYKNKISIIDSKASEELNDILKQDSILSKKNNIGNLDVCLYNSKAIRLRNIFYNWCLKQIGTNDDGYDKFMAIASQNSTHFKPNEQLEIYAGVGQFNYKTQTQVLIDNQEIKTDFEGIAEYKINVGNRKGKHSKNVSIIFTRPDGQRETVRKQITYTVD